MCKNSKEALQKTRKAVVEFEEIISLYASKNSLLEECNNSSLSSFLLQKLLQDSLIMRYETVVEGFKKILRRLLSERDITFKEDKLIQTCLDSKLLKNKEVWLEIINYRNLTSHHFTREIAYKIEKIIIKYYQLFNETLLFLENET